MGTVAPRISESNLLLDRHKDSYKQALRSILEYSEQLARIPLWPTEPGEPYWLNFWQPRLDTTSLYMFVAVVRFSFWLEVDRT